MFHFRTLVAHLWEWGQRTGWAVIAPIPYEDEDAGGGWRRSLEWATYTVPSGDFE